MPLDQSLTAEMLAIEARARGESSRIRDRVQRLVMRNRAYRHIFFGDNVNPTYRSIVLGDLMEASGIGLATPSLDHEELACLEGRRRLMLHILGRLKLNQTELDNLTTQMKELTDE